MPPSFDDLLWPDGTDNIGGTEVNHYYAPLSDIAVFPGIPTTPATLTEEVTVADDFEFNTGKKFLKIYSTLDTGKIDDKSVGEFDGKSFEHSFEFFFPGTIGEALALIRKMNNTNMVFIASEANGQKRIIGSPAFPAKMSMSDVTTGQKTADRKGTTIKVESRGVTPALIYTGAIPLTPAP
jgi:hypothetical protein